MGTVIRSEVSKKNDYWIEKHRYFELKHFCLQYPIWKQAYAALDGYCQKSASVIENSGSTDVSNPTAKYAEARVHYSKRMEMVEKTAKEASPEFSQYILMAVTEERAYPYLKTVLNIPCGKDFYYELYRRFFWLLNKVRD